MHLAAADADPAEIIRLAFEQDEINDKIARSYTFHSRIEERDFNKKGVVKSTKSRTYDVTLLDGSEYKRLIARNDEPLNPKEEQKQQRKLDKSIRKMQNETPKQRAKRIGKREKEKEEERRWVAEIQNTYDFRLRGKERVNGIDTYVIDAEPKPDYEPAFKKAKFLGKMRGTLWIGVSDYAWVKIAVETIEKLSFGWILFRLNKGSTMELTQGFVNDEVWLLDELRVRFTARLGLLKGYNREVIYNYDNFRKFSADSTITFADQVE
jgi:hypothetical protein